AIIDLVGACRCRRIDCRVGGWTGFDVRLEHHYALAVLGCGARSAPGTGQRFVSSVGQFPPESKVAALNAATGQQSRIDPDVIIAVAWNVIQGCGQRLPGCVCKPSRAV